MYPNPAPSSSSSSSLVIKQRSPFDQMAQKEQNSTKKDAGKKFTTRPKFRFIWSWYTASLNMHVFVFNTVALAVAFAKWDDDLAPADNTLWTYLLVFLMCFSTTLAASNSLHEPDEKERAWNWFKFLLLAALIGVNITFVILSNSETGDSTGPIICFVISFILSAASSHVKFVQHEIEPAPDDDIDVELGAQTFHQLKEAIEDRQKTITTLTSMMESLWHTDHRLIYDNELLKSWSSRTDKFD